MNGTRRRKVGTIVGVTVLLAALAVPTSLPASAAEVPDQVMAWNQHAYNELIVVTPPPLNAPPAAAIHLAIVHGAIYDAVNAIDGGYEPYLGAPSAGSTDSEDAAAATAGYRMLQYLLPSDRDDELLGSTRTRSKPSSARECHRPRSMAASLSARPQRPRW